MRSMVVFGGSFLFWIAARKRWPQYAALVQSAASSPAVDTGGGGTTSAGPLSSTANAVGSIVSDVWAQFKAGK